MRASTTALRNADKHVLATGFGVGVDTGRAERVGSGCVWWVILVRALVQGLQTKFRTALPP